ncbi:MULTISPECIES: YidH family protein [Aestuariimicrobium]|uniref:YidH family protein n=1 Tax=Aestuariimicrobium TaxID=396388 RepID=UPI0003B36CDF|nr:MULTISPECIES: DUF202 domain-containing protein [Aestuariimicrobium]CAI9404944.1 Inner membrane protein YidH [Aestuariimicrobium sp. T2.26MG-19.2B]
MDDKRFPTRVYSHGSEPDARFSLANERTFLAWVSTGLALVSVGVGLEAFGLSLQHGFRLATSALLVCLGIATTVHAWFNWMRVESSMRDHRPLPSMANGLVLAIGLSVAGVLVLIGIVTA